jgi:hypothetical protein
MLRASGHWQSDLLKAALLHDVGKSCVRLTIWDRTLIVVLGGLMPERTVEWGQVASGEWWRRPFVVKEQHPAWGAAMVEAAGGSSLLVSLIRRHQDKLPRQPASTEEQLLAYLQWADDHN